MATTTATTRTARRVVHFFIRWSVMASSSTSPWVLWSMILRSVRPDISSSVPRHRGSQLPTTYLNTRRYPVESKDAKSGSYTSHDLPCMHQGHASARLMGDMGAEVVVIIRDGTELYDIVL